MACNTFSSDAAQISKPDWIQIVGWYFLTTDIWQRGCVDRVNGVAKPPDWPVCRLFRSLHIGWVPTRQSAGRVLAFSNMSDQSKQFIWLYTVNFMVVWQRFGRRVARFTPCARKETSSIYRRYLEILGDGPLGWLAHLYWCNLVCISIFYSTLGEKSNGTLSKSSAFIMNLRICVLFCFQWSTQRKPLNAAFVSGFEDRGLRLWQRVGGRLSLTFYLACLDPKPLPCN